MIKTCVHSVVHRISWYSQRLGHVAMIAQRTTRHTLIVALQSSFSLEMLLSGAIALLIYLMD